jgi:hypothetical protein
MSAQTIDPAADAEALRAASAVLRRWFGGLGTTIAVLDEKATVLEQAG